MTELTLNPNLEIRPVLGGGRVIAYSLMAPVKGRGRLHNTVEVDGARPDVIGVLESIDYAAAPSDDRGWPLYLELPATGQPIAIRLAPGEGVLYRGCELPHDRHELHGERSMSFFLHYVDEAFSGHLR
jgi:hypothetical protein